jgi:hypothetical protein
MDVAYQGLSELFTQHHPPGCDSILISIVSQLDKGKSIGQNIIRANVAGL